MSKLEFKAETSDIRTKIEALLKRNGEIFLAHHNGDNYYSEKYTQKLESIVRASVGLVEALQFYADFASKENHQFIFDDERGCRAAVYERYKKCSIGDLGVKAHEALAAFRAEVEKAGKS